MSGLKPGAVVPAQMDSRAWDRWCRGQTMSLALDSYTVLTLPDATIHPRELIYVSNEAGGATIAFSDGVVWRRVQDRAQVS